MLLLTWTRTRKPPVTLQSRAVIIFWPGVMMFCGTWYSPSFIIVDSIFACTTHTHVHTHTHTHSSAQPHLSEDEKVELHKHRVDKSRFVQELLLSTLAFSDNSSEGEDT